MHAVRSGLLTAALVAVFFHAAIVAAEAATAPSADEQNAPLTLVLNGVEKGIVFVLLCADDVLAEERDLLDAGVPLRGAVYLSRSGKRYVSVASLAPNVRYDVDLPALALRLRADPKLLPRTVASLAGETSRKGKTAADPSGFLNYTFADDTISPTRNVNAFVQAGAGSEAGLLLASASYANGSSHRGLIALQRGSDEAMSRMTIGDEVAVTSMLGGSGVIGGIGFTRHFEFQPAYTYFPTLGFSGTALTPVTADVFVNGSFLRTVALPPGQFDLTNIPVPSGSNVTRVVLHDAGGNTSTLSGNSYQSRRLLAKGVTDYNYHAGFIRASPFGEDDRYGALALLGNYRLGVSDHLTLGARLEKAPNVISGGPQADLTLPLGQLSIEGGLSDAHGTGGGAFGAAYDVQLSSFSFGASALAMSARYATTTLDANAPRTRSIVAESLAFPLRKGLSLALSHSTSTFGDAPAADQVDATLAVQIRRGLNLDLSAERDHGSSALGPGFAAPHRGWTLGASVSFNLSQGSNAIAQTSSGGGSATSSLTVSKSAPNGPGFGYVVRADDSRSGTDQRFASADLTYRTQAADLLGIFDSERRSATLSLSGSLVGFKQGLFFARPVADAYALANVPGFPNVPIFVGDLYQGKTDGRGALVVPALEGYDENHVRIGELPNAVDVMEDQAALEIHPKTYQGIVAGFNVRIVRAYTGSIVAHRRGADVIPEFAHLTLNGGGRHFATDLGSHGQFYIENVPPGEYDIELTGASDLHCSLRLALPSTPRAVTQLETARCEAS